MTNPAANRTNAPRRRRPSGGFTLIELLIAVTMILVAMAGLMLLFTTALAQTGDARQRQAADALVTKTLEQVRALPYSTVAKGLDTTNSLAAEPGLSTWTYNGESVQHGTLGYTQMPFNVGNSPGTGNVGHLQRVKVGSSPGSTTTYNVATYVTQVATTVAPPPPPAYRVTVAVTWTAYGKTKTVTGQTFVYSPSGCLSTATHPFGAPCQPFFYATADTGLGAIQATPADTTVNGVAGIDLQQAQLLVPEGHATMDVEQITKVLAKGVTSGGTLDLNSGSPASAGSVGSAPQADTDPASAASPFASGTLTQAAGTLVRDDGTGANANWIRVQSSDGDTGATAATASAGAAGSPSCTTLTGTAIANLLPCASVNLQQLGATATLQLDVHTPGNDWGVTPLGSIGPAPGKTSLFASRSIVGGGPSCAGTSGAGCVHAGAIRRLGTIRMGGLPPQVLADAKAPPGWGNSLNNYLFELSGYTDQVDAESGIGPAAPAATRSGTLKYWNGAGYTTLVIGAATPATITLPTVTATDPTGSGTLQATIAGTITFGAIQTSTSGPAGCATICTATATSQSPIRANITYTLIHGGSYLAYLNLSLDLDKLEATTRYRAAPLAG